jgi:hypothetical protein
LLTERFAAEVLSILVGAIGLVLAVPLTTAVGVAVVRASGSGRTVIRPTGLARNGDSVRKQRPAAVKEQALPKQPERLPAATPEPREATTTKLPRAGRSPRPAVPHGAEPAAPDSQVKHRRSRRHADDDFGDFTYLHEPSESEPGTPESRGRRGL